MMSTEHVDLTDHLVLRGGTEPLLPPATRHTEAKRVVLDWRQALGGLLILAGGIVLAVSWVGISGEAESYKQLPYFLSGGLGGGALIALGVVCLVAYEHFCDRRSMAGLEEHLCYLEDGLGLEVIALQRRLDQIEANGRQAGNRR
jgi:hypothetical protein